MNKFLLICAATIALILTSCSDIDYEPQVSQNIPDSRAIELSDTTYKYAYYYNKRIQIPIDESKKYVIVEETTPNIVYSAPTKAPVRYTGYIVDVSEVGNSSVMSTTGNNSNIVAIEDVTSDGTPLNNFIYVGLKNESDLSMLEKLAQKIGCIVHGSILDHPKWIKLETGINSSMTSLPAAAYIYENGDFQFVDPGFEIEYETLSYEQPTDPYFNLQWNLTGRNGINITPAWNITKGSPDITLAIYDSGVANTGGEFTGRFTDFYIGKDLTISNTHGTQVASVAAAAHNDSYVAGIAPKVKIMSINRTLLSAEEYANSFIDAYQNGADIINCSWGGYTQDAVQIILEEACKEAIKSGRDGKGCVVVFAAGNNDHDSVAYPGRNINNAIIVSSTDENGKLSTFSSIGSEVTVAAPGENIPTTPNKDGKCFDSGTSFAAPHVSGLAALILSLRPELTAAQIKQLIIETASRSTHSNEYGWGLINAGYAMMAANQDYVLSCPNNTVISPKDGKLSFTLSNVPRGASVSWKSSSALRLLSSSNSFATFQYPTDKSTLINETISATISYLGKTKTVSYSCQVTLSTVVNSITKLEGYEWLGENYIHLFADCSKDNAPIEWEITGSYGCNFKLVDFLLAGDASFINNPKAYITLQFAEPFSSISVPDGAYCEITAKVNEPTGVWRRCTVRWINVWNGYEWIVEDNGALR